MNAIAYIDYINALHKPDLCYDILMRETQAQCPPKSTSSNEDPMNSPSFLAEQVGVWYVIGLTSEQPSVNPV